MSSVWDDPELGEEEVTPLPDVAAPKADALAAFPMDPQRLEAIAAEVIERVAREIVPELAERLIREQLDRLMQE